MYCTVRNSNVHVTITKTRTASYMQQYKAQGAWKVEGRGGAQSSNGDLGRYIVFCLKWKGRGVVRMVVCNMKKSLSILGHVPGAALRL